MGTFPYTENCDPELIREKIEEIEGYVASLQPGESFFENKEKGLVIRANVEVSDDGDGVNCRTIGVVREEEGNDKKGWLVAAKGGHIFVVRELVDNKDYGLYECFTANPPDIRNMRIWLSSASGSVCDCFGGYI